MAIRPSEVAACKWENLDGDVYHVREAAPYGNLGDTKTERSKRDLTIIEPVLSLLKTWHSVMGDPKAGLMFEGADRGPVTTTTSASTASHPRPRKPALDGVVCMPAATVLQRRSTTSPATSERLTRI